VRGPLGSALEPARHLDVGLDGDALGHQVLADHVDRRLAGDLLGVAPHGEPRGVEVGLSAELDDAVGDRVGLELLGGGALQGLLGERLTVNAPGHEVVACVPRDAHPLGGQRLVEPPNGGPDVGLATRRDRAPLDRVARPAPQILDVGQELFVPGPRLSFVGTPSRFALRARDPGRGGATVTSALAALLLLAFPGAAPAGEPEGDRLALGGWAGAAVQPGLPGSEHAGAFLLGATIRGWLSGPLYLDVDAGAAVRPVPGGRPEAIPLVHVGLRFERVRRGVGFGVGAGLLAALPTNAYLGFGPLAQGGLVVAPSSGFRLILDGLVGYQHEQRTATDGGDGIPATTDRLLIGARVTVGGARR